jgi:flavocytochrome c
MRSETWDIVVIGAGLAGIRAALVASSLGARTLVLEKMPEPGGSSVLAGGFFAFAGTNAQKSRGLEDSLELMRKDFLDLGKSVNDAAIVDAYCKHQLPEYEYLAGLGVDFMEVQPSSGHSVPRGHRADPRQFMTLLLSQARQSSLIEIRTSACATRLSRAYEQGAIDTVYVRQGDVTERILARRGIILASGGFSRAQDLLELFAPHVKIAIPAGGLGNDGDGIRMAWEHGAGLADLGYINGTFGTYPWPEAGELAAVIFPVYRGGIAVNIKGERFVNESKSYKALGEAVLEQEKGYAYQVFDESIMTQSLDNVPSYNFRSMERLGRIKSAASIEELAQSIDVPVESLANTVKRYNEDAKSGRDTVFGRNSLSHTFGQISPLVSPPYYAYPCTCMLSTTYGGLKIDSGMRVLNVWGEPIAGLYAAGELVGGLHGASYMTGSALGKALIFGAIAARTALSPSS